MEPDFILQVGSQHFKAGLQPSLPIRQPVFWQYGKNVLFHEDSIQSLPILQHLFVDKQEENPVKGIGAVTIDGVPTLFYGTTTNLYKYTDAGGVELVGSGYSPDTTRWVIEPYGKWMTATNNIDPVQIYKGAPFAQLGGTMEGRFPFTRARMTARNRNFLFCINTDFDARGVHWAERDEPEHWDLQEYPTAGFIPVRESDSELVGSVQVDQTLFVASNYSVHSVNFVQAPLVYGINKVLDGVGAVGPHAMVTANRQFFSFGLDFIWASSGVTYEDISTPAVTRFIYGDLNREALHLVEGWNLASHSYVLWFYPRAGSPVNNRLAGYNYKTGSWTIWDFGEASVEDNLVFPQVLFGGSGGDILFMDFSDLGQENLGIPLTLRKLRFFAHWGFGRMFGVGFGGRIIGDG